MHKNRNKEFFPKELKCILNVNKKNDQEIKKIYILLH